MNLFQDLLTYVNVFAVAATENRELTDDEEIAARSAEVNILNAARVALNAEDSDNLFLDAIYGEGYKVIGVNVVLVDECDDLVPMFTLRLP